MELYKVSITWLMKADIRNPDNGSCTPIDHREIPAEDGPDLAIALRNS